MPSALFGILLSMTQVEKRSLRHQASWTRYGTSWRRPRAPRPRRWPREPCGPWVGMPGVKLALHPCIRGWSQIVQRDFNHGNLIALCKYNLLFRFLFLFLPLFESGLEKDVKCLIDNTGRGWATSDDASGGGKEVEHVMLSYEWGCQQSVLLIKSELQKAGVWPRMGTNLSLD